MSTLPFWTQETGAKLREGENLICSPLRQDTHPSFSLNTETGLWFDHGTGQGGDVFDFVQIKYGLSFPEAKSYLEQHCGTLPNNGERPKQKPIKEPVRQGSKEGFCFIEVVKSGIYRRGTFERRAETPNYFKTSGAVDCFHSMYLHSAEIVSYQKQHGNLKGYSGAVWCRGVVFDVDFKDGAQEENIEHALDETRKLIRKIKGLGISKFSIKFSGSKGFHVSFSCPALDEISGYTDTPERVEKLARKLAEGINGIDFSIYGSATRLIRSLNSINSKSGLYAIPLTEAELFSLSPAQIIEMATKPLRLSPYPVRAYSRVIGEPFTINEGGAVLFQSGVSFTEEEIAKLRLERDKDTVKKIFMLKKHFQGRIL